MVLGALLVYSLNLDEVGVKKLADCTAIHATFSRT